MYCIRVSRILMLQGRVEEGESVGLGLDFPFSFSRTVFFLFDAAFRAPSAAARRSASIEIDTRDRALGSESFNC